MARQIFEVRCFPFRVGREPGNNLVLNEPGVWQEHFEILREGNFCAIKAIPPASLAVNGESVASTVLHNGDQIEIAALQLDFALAPVAFRDLRAREIVIWAALAGVFVLQFWLIYRLLR